MLAPQASRNTQILPFAFQRPRLLLVGDSPEHLQNLQSAVNQQDFEITRAASFEELARACHDSFDAIALDVAPVQLAPMLKLIRMSGSNEQVSVLVEASRLQNDLNLAGVLPRYRAMPCGKVEMVRLLRQQTDSPAAAQHPRGVL